MPHPIAHEQGSILTVERRVAARTVALWMLTCAVVWGVAAPVIAWLARDPALITLELVTVILLALATFFALSNRRTRFDFAARRVRGPGLDLAFDQLAAIAFGPYVHTATPIGTDGTETSTLYWRVKLLDQRVIEAGRTLEAIAGRRRELERQRGAPLSPAEGDPCGDIGPPLEQIDAGTHILADHSEAAAVLLAARLLCRRLGLPLRGDSGEGTEHRLPEEAELPILQRRPAAPGKEPPRPVALEEEETADRLTLRWRRSRILGMAFASCCSLVLGCLGTIGLSNGKELGPVLLLVAVVPLVLIPKLSRGHGRNELIVDAQRCAWRSRPLWPCEESMPLAELDSIYVVGHSNDLLLLSPSQELRVPMREEAAAWVRYRLLRFLAARALPAPRDPPSA